MQNSRRQFMILSAAGACTLALNGQVQARAFEISLWCISRPNVSAHYRSVPW